METSPSFFTILLTLTIANLLLQGLVATNLDNEELMLSKRLEIINKPAVKSFTTEYGDILDCIDINKQYAFDHPLLKNHSIQMKPTRTVKRSKSINLSRILPKNVNCPKGTVLIRRVRKEDLLMEKFTPSFLTSNVSNGNGHEVAGVVVFNKNGGLSATIDVWNPTVKAGQYSATAVYIASEDGPLNNVIQTGWMVSPVVYPNSTQTRLYGYWTKDSGQSSGCYDMLCPGFVQVSRKVHFGQVLPTDPSKPYNSSNILDFYIPMDDATKNWWLMIGNEQVGYWPKELFTTMKSFATRAGFGGDVYSPPNLPLPEMGSGVQANEAGYGRVCLMKRIGIQEPLGTYQSRRVNSEALAYHILMTNPTMYNVIQGNIHDWGDYIFFGGPLKIKTS